VNSIACFLLLVGFGIKAESPDSNVPMQPSKVGSAHGIAPIRKMQIAIWRAFPDIFAPKGAPMLEFGICI